MRTVERASTARDTGVNLDRVVATADYSAVLDGATVKSPDLDLGIAATAALVDDLACTLTSLAPDLSAGDVIAALTATAARHSGPLQPRATGAVYSAHLRQVIILGDVWVAVDGVAQFFGHRTEEALARLRAAFTELALAGGADVDDLRERDPGRAAILPLLAREAEFGNVDGPGEWFFATLNGRRVPHRLVRTVPVPPEATELTLASDGYPALGPDLASTERLLAKAVAEDPLRIRTAPGTKAVPPHASGYDDRSYLRLAL